MKIKLACGTDDGVNFTEEHFGDAKLYLIYEIDTETKEIEFLEKIENTSPEEKMHGDPRKAKKISGIMKDILILVGFAMGTNILRIRKNFVPVISREMEISIALESLKKKIDDILPEIAKEKGVDRRIFYV